MSRTRYGLYCTYLPSSRLYGQGHRDSAAVAVDHCGEGAWVGMPVAVALGDADLALMRSMHELESPFWLTS